MEIEIVLGAAAIILAAISFYQHGIIKKRDKDLKYITEKLEKISGSIPSERLQVVTSDKAIIDLVMSVNDVLENSINVMHNYTKTEISMRKMLSNISHDLKTPLTVIMGYIETIRLELREGCEEDILLSKVQNKTREMLLLINKFFDLAKLESGDKEIDITRINICEICRKNILTFYDILSSKNFDVKVKIPERSLYVWGNEEALGRILNNLISNALKYGSEGQVIGLDVIDDKDFVCVEVWDKGRGIDEENRDKVFERMYTLDDSRNKEYQGSGLGLTITKRLVEKLGGDIELTSLPYEKTAFTVRLKKADM